MNRFWGLKLAIAGTGGVASQPAISAPQAQPQDPTVMPKLNPPTTGVSPTSAQIMPPPPMGELKTAQILTDEGRETLGQILGGLGGMAGGATAAETLGQLYKPMAEHGGYSPTMIKLLKGEEVAGIAHGKNIPVRLALAALMGLPYAASMTAGQRFGGNMAKKYNAPEQQFRSRR